MQITTSITLDVKHPGIPPVIDAVQYDENTRYVEAEIMDGGVAWEIPGGAVGFVGIAKPDGTYAYYEYDAGGAPAVEVSGNVARFILVPEALAAAGVAKGGLSFYSAAGDKLTTFAFSVRIQPSAVPDNAVTSSDYFNFLTVEIAKAIAAAESVMGMTASAETLPSTAKATAEVTEAGGKLNLHLGIPAGPEGAAGPNAITASTLTPLTGLLAGNGANVQAVTGTAEQLAGFSDTGAAAAKSHDFVGANLLIGTRENTKPPAWWKVSDEWYEKDDDGYGVNTIIAANGGMGGYFTDYTAVIGEDGAIETDMPEGKYTLSMDVMSTVNVNTNIGAQLMIVVEKDGGLFDAGVISVVTVTMNGETDASKWKRATKDILINKNMQWTGTATHTGTGRIVLGVYTRPNAAMGEGDYVKSRKIKLEKGDFATPWCPHASEIVLPGAFGRDQLSVPAPTYTYGGKDLSKIYTPEQLHNKIAAGDYEGIRMGDYWPITLNGTYHDYADDADKTLSNAVVNLEFMPYFYGQYGDTMAPNHCLVCSRDCLPTALKMRSADETWYDTAATNPMLGSHLYQTLNNAENGIIKLVEQTELGPYIYTGPNGKGMRFLMETKAAGVTAATGWAWGDRGKLFLPYEREVWGQDIWSEHTYGGSGNALQWPIFAGSRRHIAKGWGDGGSRYAWWCASSVAGSAATFCDVHYYGTANYGGASSAFGVPICFLIV